MSANTRWEDVLGNAGFSALEALSQIGCDRNDSVKEVAMKISIATKQMYSDPREQMSPEEAEDIARQLLREANS